jgi:hypothetical protein
MKLPTFEEAEAACDAGTATPLEQFIFHNELGLPKGADHYFRLQLLDALNFATRESTIYTEI